MNDRDLFAGFDAYTTGAELGLFDDDMAAAGFTPSSGPCIRLSAETVRQTVVHEC